MSCAQGFDLAMQLFEHELCPLELLAQPALREVGGGVVGVEPKPEPPAHQAQSPVLVPIDPACGKDPLQECSEAQEHNGSLGSRGGSCWPSFPVPGRGVCGTGW
jgi:hypothetical protein